MQSSPKWTIGDSHQPIKSQDHGFRNWEANLFPLMSQAVQWITKNLYQLVHPDENI